MKQVVLAHGRHDRFTTLDAFNFAELEAMLVPQKHLRHECVTFAGGAVLLPDGQTWVVVHGNDRTCDLYAFDRAALETLMVPVESLPHEDPHPLPAVQE